MANNLTSDPMVIDTAGNPLTTGRVFNIFKSVEWVNPGAVGDRAKLLDAQGQVMCDYTCTQAKKGERKEYGDVGTPFDGPLNLVQLDSGYLLVSRV